MRTDFRDRDCPVDEEVLVQGWRFEQFRSLGFGDWEALTLARTVTVDLAGVRRLVEHGCPPETALRIVL